MIKRALVFQHMDDEPPGLYGEFLRGDGVALDTVMLHKGETIPSLAPYDFLLVMGGAMDVWETEAHPWLVAEKQAIAEWAINRNRPYLGVCLGLQLLTEALGGTVGLAAKAEVGVHRVTLTRNGRSNSMTSRLARTIQMMQWHHAEVKSLPDGAEILASSPLCHVQIMALGRELLGTQFHGELTPDLIARWANIPQYIEWLDAALGSSAYERVCAQALPLMPQMREVSRRLYDNLVHGKRLSAAA